MQRALIEKYRASKLKGKVQHIGIYADPKDIAIKEFNVEYLYEFTCKHLRQYSFEFRSGNK